MVNVPVGEPDEPGGRAARRNDAAIGYGSGDAAVTTERAACPTAIGPPARQRGGRVREIADRQRAGADGRAAGIRIVGGQDGRA